MVAGQPGTVLVDHGDRVLTPAEVGPIAALLDEPMRDFATEVTVPEKDPEGHSTGCRRRAHVWHCSLALHPDEPELTDDTWRQVAERYVALLGFDPVDGTPACRWVAVKHGRSAAGSDHVHVVVNLVREDGKPASVHMDRPRAQQACRQLEQEFGLRQVEGRGRGAGERGLKPAEIAVRERGGTRNPVGRIPVEHTARRHLERVVRACATAASDEPDFVARLRAEGVLVRPRFDKGGTNDVAGYSVALRPSSDGKPVWYGGGRLSRELTLPRLRAAWPELERRQIATGAWQRAATRDTSPRTSTPPTRELEAQCARQLAQLRDRLQSVPPEDCSTWALVARDTAGILAAWSLRTEPHPGPLAQAGRELARTAQLRAAQVPDTPRRPLPPTQNTAALILQAATRSRPGRKVFAQVTALSEAIHDMHAAAGAAQRAAEMEHTALAQLAAIATMPGHQAPPRPAIVTPDAGARERSAPPTPGRELRSRELEI